MAPGESGYHSPRRECRFAGKPAGVWPADGSGLKLGDLCACFDGLHTFEERCGETDIEQRPIPKAPSHVVYAAVSDAVRERRLWLVFGTDSVFGETPTTLQLDSEAAIYPPPEQLAVADLLPPNLPAAWTNEGEPRTTPSSLYVALKSACGKPWPEKLFLGTVNAALGQGYFVRCEGTGPVSSLQHEGDVPLVIRQGKPVFVEPPLIPPGRKFSNSVTLGVGEVQSLGDVISDLVTALAGMEPEIEIRISIKAQQGQNYVAANEILDRLKPGWKL